MDEQLNQDQQDQQQEAAATSGEGHQWTPGEIAAIQAQGVKPLEMNMIQSTAALDAGTTSASGTQSSAANASQGDDTAVNAESHSGTGEGEQGKSIGDVSLQDPASDAHTKSGGSPGDDSGNASAPGASDGSGAESPNGRHPAHRWIDLAELKLAAIEHAAVAELLDIMRNLRQEM
jgi:hypothetical protein